MIYCYIEECWKIEYELEMKLIDVKEKYRFEFIECFVIDMLNMEVKFKIDRKEMEEKFCFEY